MNYDMTKLRLQTLRGDIQTCLMDGLSRRGVWELLYSRYVHGTEVPITKEDLNSVLDEECRKVEAQRIHQKAK